MVAATCSGTEPTRLKARRYLREPSSGNTRRGTRPAVPTTSSSRSRARPARWWRKIPRRTLEIRKPAAPRSATGTRPATRTCRSIPRKPRTRPRSPEAPLTSSPRNAMSETYVHGYHQRENERLQDQAGTLVDLLHSDTAYPGGSKVLEVGCGVGAQTMTLAQRSPEARFTSIDISADSLAEARRRIEQAGLTNVEFRQADIFDLAFADTAHVNQVEVITPGDLLGELRGQAVGPRGDASGDRLADREHVRPQVPRFRAPTGPGGEGVRLVVDEQASVLAGELAHAREVAVRRQHDPDVGERRFHEHRGHVAVGQLALHPLEVVELDHPAPFGHIDGCADVAGSARAFAIGTDHDQRLVDAPVIAVIAVSYTHLRAHETRHDLVCRLLLEKKKDTI